MVILGIDPGSRITGYGVIKQSGQQVSYLGSGTVKTGDADLAVKLAKIYAGVREIITQFAPDVLAIEQVFMAKNADSALKLGQARGTAIVAAANAKLPVFEYSARRVKQSVTGTGAAKKEQVQEMVKYLLKLTARPQADAADALAIALTHANSFHHQLRIAHLNGGTFHNDGRSERLHARYARGRLSINRIKRGILYEH